MWAITGLLFLTLFLLHTPLRSLARPAVAAPQPVPWPTTFTAYGFTMPGPSARLPCVSFYSYTETLVGNRIDHGAGSAVPQAMVGRVDAQAPDQRPAERADRRDPPARPPTATDRS